MDDESKRRLGTLADLLRPKRLTRIVDVGANPVNTPPYQPLRDAGLCEVWGFEPHPEAYKRLLKAPSPHEHYLPYAVGDGAPGTLHICASEGFTSLLPPNRATLDYLGRWHRLARVTQHLTVETRRLDDMAELPPPDLFKIDVQGAEAMIFRNARTTLSQAVAVITEVAFVPLYEDQPLYQDQAAILHDYGFLLAHFQFLKRRSVGSPLMRHLHWKRHQAQVIDGDAVFVRSLLDPAAWSDEQLVHLALVADGAMGSFDLVVKALSLLIARGALTEDAVTPYLRLIPHPAA